MHNEPTLDDPRDDELEVALRLSLRRVEAPPGFVATVLRRLDTEESHDLGEDAGPSRRSSSLSYGRHFPYALTLGKLPAIGLVAALLLILLVPLGNYVYQQHQQTRAEAAARQFTLAMHLTQAALLDAGQQVANHGHAREAE